MYFWSPCNSSISPLKRILRIDLARKMMFNSVIRNFNLQKCFWCLSQGAIDPFHLPAFNLPSSCLPCSFRVSILFWDPAEPLSITDITPKQQYSLNWMLRWMKAVTDVTIIHHFREKRSMKITMAFSLLRGSHLVWARLHSLALFPLWTAAVYSWK